MEAGREEVVKKIKEFYKLLEVLPDQPSSVFGFIAFLRSIIRVKSSVTIPTIEIMTILKVTKPIIFSTLRKKVNEYEFLRFLVDLSEDKSTAEGTLKSFLND